MRASLPKIRLLAVLGLAAFGLTVLFLNMLSLQGQWDSRRPFDNPVDNWAKRVESIPSRLPPGVTTVGYAADWDIPGATYNPIDQDAEYMITQYVLAPLVVKPGLDHEWIIGNFTVPGFEAWLDANLPSYEMRSLKTGIYLIHRPPP